MEKKQVVVLIFIFLLIVGLGRPSPALAKSFMQSDPILPCTQGISSYLQGQRTNAKTLLENGFDIMQETTAGDPNIRGQCAFYLGQLRQSIGDWDGALLAYTAALDTFRAIDDQQLEWGALFGIGSVYMSQGRVEEGKDTLQEALNRLETTTQIWIPNDMQSLAEAATLNNLAIIKSREASLLPLDNPDAQLLFTDAQDDFMAVLQMLEALQAPIVNDTTSPMTESPGDEPCLTLADWMNLILQEEAGNILGEDVDSALPFNLFDLPLGSDESNLLGEDTTDQDCIPASVFAGDDTERPDEQAMLMLLQLLNELTGEGGADQNQPGLPVDFLETLLTGLESPEDFLDPTALFSGGFLDELVQVLSRDLQALVWNNRGETYRMQEQYTEALDAFEQSHLIATESLNQEGLMAPTSQQFGLVNQALAWNNNGLALYDLGDLTGALEQFEQAETAARKVSNPLFLVRILMGIGTLNQEQGLSTEALVAFEEAMDIMDGLRVVTDSQLSQVGAEGGSQVASFALSGSLVQFAELYPYVAGIYHQLGMDEQAFYTAERGRARLFLNMLTAGQLELLDEMGVDLLAQERDAFILRQIARDDVARIEHLTVDAMTQNILLAEKDTAEAEYEAILAKIEAQDSSFSTLVSSEINVLQIEEVQALLDEQTTLIVYYQLLDQARSNLAVGGMAAFIITKDAFETVTLPEATAVNLNTAVTSLHEWLNRDQPHPKPLRDLHGWLIAPLAEHISTPSVGIIPHQTLHYVPFAALTDGETYFGAERSLFVLPSAAVLPLIQSSAASADHAEQSALVFGNPVTNLSPLPHAETEAQAVADLLGTAVYIGSEANESRLWQSANNARVVHLAAHGTYENLSPLESAIHLSADGAADGRLTVAEIYQLDLQATEMVVLSACQTNVGDVSAGDEVVGLTRAFFNAGTSSVMASLWVVDDAATQALMVAFYEYWLTDGLSKAEALQAAQAHVRSLENGRYASPFYWAGFVLNGDGGTYARIPDLAPTPTAVPTIVPIATETAVVPTNIPVATLETVAETIASNETAEPLVTPEGERQDGENRTGFCSTAVILLPLVLISLQLRKKRR